MCLKHETEERRFTNTRKKKHEVRQTLLLSVARNKAGADKKKIKLECGYLPCGRRPVSQTGGDIMLTCLPAGRL